MSDTAPSGEVVVTGAARGIGRATAERLVADGWPVLAIDRDAAALAELTGPSCRTVTLDLSDPAAIEAFAASRRGEGAPLAALVNNAAVQGGAPIGEQSLDDWNRFLAVNVTAPWLLTRGLLPLLADGGAIVNVGSVASVTGFAGRTAYCASKHALAGLTKALAVELAPRRIRCNLLCLGSFATPGLLELAGERRAAFEARQLLERFGDPAEAADAIAYLISPRTAFITGTTLTVDGGMLLKPPAP